MQSSISSDIAGWGDHRQTQPKHNFSSLLDRDSQTSHFFASRPMDAGMKEEEETLEGIEERKLRNDDDGFVGEDLKIELSVLLQVQLQRPFLLRAQKLTWVRLKEGQGRAVQLKGKNGSKWETNSNVSFRTCPNNYTAPDVSIQSARFQMEQFIKSLRRFLPQMLPHDGFIKRCEEEKNKLSVEYFIINLVWHDHYRRNNKKYSTCKPMTSVWPSN